MSKAIPRVRSYMTRSPHSIGVEQTMLEAHERMRAHRIRHLPVLSGGKLVGLVTERDLHLVETLKDTNPAQVSVEDAMSQSVYSVSPDAPLDEVVSAMAEHKYGSAVVMEGDHVVGILTTVDVCAALAAVLHGKTA